MSSWPRNALMEKIAGFAVTLATRIQRAPNGSALPHASVHEHMRTHARAHVCRRTPNPMDAELVGSAVPGRIPAKRQPLPPLYTENTVLFSMLARWIALVAHASHRHQL